MHSRRRSRRTLSYPILPAYKRWWSLGHRTRQQPMQLSTEAVATAASDSAEYLVGTRVLLEVLWRLADVVLFAKIGAEDIMWSFVSEAAGAAPAGKVEPRGTGLQGHDEQDVEGV